MKILNSLILIMLLQVSAFGQCQDSDFPQDVGMYDVYVCHSEKGFQPMKKGAIHKRVEFYFDLGDVTNVYAIDFGDGEGSQDASDY